MIWFHFHLDQIKSLFSSSNLFHLFFASFVLHHLVSNNYVGSLIEMLNYLLHFHDCSNYPRYRWFQRRNLIVPHVHLRLLPALPSLPLAFSVCLLHSLSHIHPKFSFAFLLIVYVCWQPKVNDTFDQKVTCFSEYFIYL